MMKFTKTLLALSLSPSIFSLPAYAHDAVSVEEVLVTGIKERLYQSGMLKDVIQKTEVISAESIQKEQAENITQAIAKAPGVRVNNECSMCGVKRVMLNGLRGEHTTILVDGIPTHSMASGFYGLDATSSAGIERIEIARGAGASLTAPEAIGGTINLITKEARKDALDIDITGGENGYKKVGAVGTLVTNEDSTRITAIAQTDSRDQYDGDNNRVSENPRMENQTFTLRLAQDIGEQDNITLRGSHASSEVFGGPMGTSISAVRKDYFSDPEFSSEHLFEGDDVRNPYIGKGWETTEWIDTSRNELAGSWLHEANEKLNFTLTTSLSQHEQKSFYEGFIYNADNDVQFNDARVNYALTSNHHLTFGVDSRRESLRSRTNSTSENYISDSFDYDSSGIYVQDTWTATNALQIALALRADKLNADFVDPKKPGSEIDQTLVSPRVDMRLTHSDAWNSRLSFGQGYRVPLSFFESDHGLLDSGAGFNIDIDRLERSKSANYSLNFEQDKLTATGSIAYTTVENLAQLTADENDVPTLSQLQKNVAVAAYDLSLTYKLNEHVSVSGILENFDYDSDFKQAYSVAPIEQRITLSADVELGHWDTFISAVWISSRDLAQYGTPANPTFDAQGNLPKSTQAPSYWILDIQTAYEINDQYKIYLGANNLLDYTQVSDMQTPLFYEDGGFDVAHIYGPLRGREIYLGLKCTF
jgi:outer membrane receptor for ferrienterochelin and colicins